MPSLDVGGRVIDCDFILFDFDGTLVEDNFRNGALGIARYEEIQRLAGIDAANRWAVLSGFDPETRVVDVMGPIARASRKEDNVVAAGAIWQNGIDWYEAMELAHEAYTEADRQQSIKYVPELFPGTREALTRLKDAGFTLGVATNGSGKTSREILTAIGVEHLFDVFTGADEVTEGKPDPSMLFLACERVGVKPDRSVYVGDEGTDLIAATNAGFATGIAVEVDEDLGHLTKIILESVSNLATHLTS